MSDLRAILAASTDAELEALVGTSASTPRQAQPADGAADEASLQVQQAPEGQGGDGGSDEEHYPLSPRLRELLARVHRFGQACSAEQRELFLMELISNAFHALDMVFFKGVRTGLFVRLTTGKLGDVVRLTVKDNGVGMTRGDIINNLSSLSRLEDPDVYDVLMALADGSDRPAPMEEGGGGGAPVEAGNGGDGGGNGASSGSEGEALRFGFWAAFLVADRVLVQSRHDDDETYLMELGAGDTHFAIRKADVAEARASECLPDGRGSLSGRGTAVHLMLRPTVGSGIDEARLRAMVGGWGNAGLAVSSNYPLLFDSDPDPTPEEPAAAAPPADNGDGSKEAELDDTALEEMSARGREAAAADDARAGSAPGAMPQQSMLERAKYIPLRLSYEDRKVLRLAESALTVSSYTDRVDNSTLAEPKKAPRRKQVQLQQMCAMLSGLVVACQYVNGQALLEDRNFAQYERFYQKVFEIVRRYKIMNPEKMRSTYGKLLYLLQDAAGDECRELLGFNIVSPIHTVHQLLRKRNGLKVLEDPLIHYATEEILALPGQSRHQIQQRIQRKERSIEALVRKYASAQLPPDDIRTCCYSICDNNSYLNSNRLPIDKMIVFLDESFAPDVVQTGYSLSIVQGQDGARLTHSHERQFHFARQSLLLWRQIINDMFRLWALSEEDLLSADAPYALKNTGQGLQRVQPSPRTYRAMQHILHDAQRQVEQWIGSSMIHMGDHNVPNALNFIDKYNQVARILSPLVNTLEQLDKLVGEDDGIKGFIDEGFGGFSKLRQDILHDFFRSAFDGSGADNFYDAGSCIDGRLTSAWNWCQQLPTKPFFPVFRLAGFSGFDGEFE